MGAFSQQSSSAHLTQFVKGSLNQCVLVDALTAYSLYTPRDYKRCVCYSWSTDLDNCLTAIASATEASSQEDSALMTASTN